MRVVGRIQSQKSLAVGRVSPRTLPHVTPQVHGSSSTDWCQGRGPESDIFTVISAAAAAQSLQLGSSVLDYCNSLHSQRSCAKFFHLVAVYVTCTLVAADINLTY